MQIHELNNFNGNLDSSAYLAVDNGSDTGKVSTVELLADTNAAVSKLDTVLNGRIDNIVAGGEAPSASEIVDARYGADGVTYPSLGAAIRDQVTDLKSDKADKSTLALNTDFHEITGETTEGKYKGEDGITGSVANASFTTFSVKEGEQYKITTYGGVNVPYVVWYSSSETLNGTTFLSHSGSLSGTTKIVDELFVVPEGAKGMAVNNRYFAEIAMTVKKYYATEFIESVKDYVNKAVEPTQRFIEDADFEIENLERRVLNAEKGNDFAWKEFDKPYFVFIQDDTNEHLESFAQVFLDNSVPFSASAIVATLNDNKVSILNDIVTNGGEVLAHYSGSPNDSSTDEEWLSITRDVKKALEEKGFEIRGIIRADNTASATNKGEKYCRRYFDYANRGMGQSTQYNIPRMGMWNYETLEDFISQIDSDSTKNGIHAYGFHGKTPDKDWLTPENFTTIINHIKNIGGCEFATYRDIFDTFGTTVLEKRLSALENV